MRNTTEGVNMSCRRCWGDPPNLASSPPLVLAPPVPCYSISTRYILPILFYVLITLMTGPVLLNCLFDGNFPLVIA